MKPRIVIDSREAVAVPKIVSSLRESEVDIRVELLESGDYYIPSTNPVIIERKQVMDLVGSIKSKRMWNELEKMMRTEARPLLLIEGSLSLIEKFTKWNPKSIVGIINSIVFEWQIPTVTVPSQRWTVIYLIGLAEDLVKEKENKIVPLRVKEKTEKPEDYIRMVVEGLPNVGGQRAIKLLEHFETIRNLANASPEELTHVEGIGKKIAEKIYETFNSKFFEKKTKEEPEEQKKEKTKLKWEEFFE